MVTGPFTEVALVFLAVREATVDEMLVSMIVSDIFLHSILQKFDQNQ